MSEDRQAEYRFWTGSDEPVPDEWSSPGDSKSKPELAHHYLEWPEEPFSEEQTPLSILVSEQVAKDPIDRQAEYRFWTGSDEPVPDEWSSPKGGGGDVAPQDKMILHFKNLHDDHNLSILHYNRQKRQARGEDIAGISGDIDSLTKKLASGQAEFESMKSGWWDSIMSGGSSFLYNAVYGSGKVLQGALGDRAWDDYFTGKELREHKQYTMEQAQIHSAIDLAGETAFWLMPAGVMGKVSKMVKSHRLTMRLFNALKEAGKWETVLATPDILHKVLDEELFFDERLNEGTRDELESTILHDSYKDIVIDNLPYAAMGGVMGLLGRVPKTVKVPKVLETPGVIKTAKMLRAERVTAADRMFERLFKASRVEPAIEKLTFETIKKELPQEAEKEILRMIKKKIFKGEGKKIAEGLRKKWPAATEEKILKATEEKLLEIKGVLKKPGMPTKVKQLASAWFPTYSAYVERRFGKVGMQVLYKDVHRATQKAETRIALQLEKLFEGTGPAWFKAINKLKLPTGQVVEMTRGEVLHVNLLRKRGFHKFDFHGKIIDLGKKEIKLNPDIQKFADKISVLFEKQGQRLKKHATARGEKFEKVANYYPIHRVGYEKPPALHYKKGTWHLGFMKERVKSNLPIRVESVEYVLRRSVEDAERLMAQKQSTERAITIVKKLGNLLNQAESKMLVDQLMHNYGIRATETSLEKGLRGLMRNITVSYLGVNPFVAAKQVFSAPLAMTYVKGKYFLKGYNEYVVAPKKVTKFFEDNSFFAKQRLTGRMNKEMEELMRQTAKTAPGRLFVKAREKSMAGIKFMDKQAVIPIMNGAYKQAHDEIIMGKLSKEVAKTLNVKGFGVPRHIRKDAQKYAIEFAESVVARTQPMFDPLNRSRLANSGVIGRSCTMFGSATNQMFSLLWRTRKDPKKFAKAFMWIQVNVAGVMGIDYLRDVLYNREKYRPESFWEGFREVALTEAGFVYLARDLASWIKYYRYGNHVENPLSGWSDNMAESTYNFLMDMSRGEMPTEYHMKQSVMAISTALGIPTFATEIGIEGLRKTGAPIAKTKLSNTKFTD